MRKKIDKVRKSMGFSPPPCQGETDFEKLAERGQLTDKHRNEETERRLRDVYRPREPRDEHLGLAKFFGFLRNSILVRVFCAAIAINLSVTFTFIRLFYHLSLSISAAVAPSTATLTSQVIDFFSFRSIFFRLVLALSGDFSTICRDSSVQRENVFKTL